MNHMYFLCIINLYKTIIEGDKVIPRVLVEML
jgi:hypothetical protein